DLHATILHLLGFDHTKLTYRFQGRDFRLTDVHGGPGTKLLPEAPPAARALDPSRARWQDRARDEQTRRSAAPARPRAAAPHSRSDRPGVRGAAGGRGAPPRRAHVGRPPQPPVPARLRRVAVLLPDDAAHRARDGAAAPWR